MRFLSEDAKLSCIYTNHSIRATVITSLNEAGYEARHIIAITGHKSESTVKQYATKCPLSKKRSMSNALTEQLNPSKVVKTESDENAFKNQPPTPPFQTINMNDLNLQLQLPDDNEDLFLSQVLDDIERQYAKENQQINAPQQPQQPPPPPTNPPVQNTKSVTTVNNISNVVEHCRPPMPITPGMYFPHSIVTINYNIINKQ